MKRLPLEICVIVNYLSYLSGLTFISGYNDVKILFLKTYLENRFLKTKRNIKTLIILLRQINLKLTHLYIKNDNNNA